MFLSKNNYIRFKNVNFENNYFGNDWGLFVDIEKIKPNFPNNHEIIRKKYNVNFDKKNYCDDIDFCCETTKIDIDINSSSYFIKS